MRIYTCAARRATDFLFDVARRLRANKANPGWPRVSFSVHSRLPFYCSRHTHVCIKSHCESIVFATHKTCACVLSSVFDASCSSSREVFQYSLRHKYDINRIKVFTLLGINSFHNSIIVTWHISFCDSECQTKQISKIWFIFVFISIVIQSPHYLFTKQFISKLFLVFD